MYTDNVAQVCFQFSLLSCYLITLLTVDSGPLTHQVDSVTFEITFAEDTPHDVFLITFTRTHLSPYLAFWPLPDSSSSIFAPSLSSSLRRWSVLYHLSNCHHHGFPDYNAQAGGHRPPSSPRVHCLPSEHWVPINILIIDHHQHHQHPPPPHHHDQVLNQKVFVSRLLHSSDPPSFSTNSSPTAWKVIIIPISSSSQYYH